jgi:hypothetical protein
VIGREYFARQVAILFKFAKATKDPEISSALLEKAAALKDRVESIPGPFTNHQMKRYFFDIRDGDQLAVDDEGLELPDVEAAKEEAARALADIARDEVSGRLINYVAIEVRDENRPILEASLRWKIKDLMQ